MRSYYIALRPAVEVLITRQGVLSVGTSGARPSLLIYEGLKAQKGRSGSQCASEDVEWRFSKYERSKLNVMYIIKEKLPLSTFNFCFMPSVRPANDLKKAYY